MKKIRIGNDFIFLWAIERNGEPEDFSNAVNIRLHFKNFDYVGEVKSFQIVDGNIVRVEVSPEWASNLGAYRLILSYEFENSSYSDGDQKCVVDVLAFTIVSKTSEADDVKEMAKTTDIMIGLKGDKGDPFTYDDFTPEQIEDLKRPAIEAAESVQIIENQISINEQSRVQAENERKTAEATRVSNENNRVTDEQARVDAEIVREQQEQARQANTAIAIENANEAASNANEAASNANEAASNANEAASNANEARLAIEGDLTAINENIWQLSNGVIDDEEVIATDLNELAARVSALEAAFRNMIISKMQVDSIDVLKDLNYQGRPIFIVSNVAPNIVPDGVPQFWINTATGDFYSAKNNTSVNDWILI